MHALSSKPPAILQSRNLKDTTSSRSVPQLCLAPRSVDLHMFAYLVSQLGPNPHGSSNKTSSLAISVPLPKFPTNVPSVILVGADNLTAEEAKHQV